MPTKEAVSGFKLGFVLQEEADCGGFSNTGHHVILHVNQDEDWETSFALKHLEMEKADFHILKEWLSFLDLNISPTKRFSFFWCLT